jgi:hypothetical protein
MEDGDWREAFQARPSSRPDDDDLPVVSTFFSSSFQAIGGGGGVYQLLFVAQTGVVDQISG